MPNKKPAIQLSMRKTLLTLINNFCSIILLISFFSNTAVGKEVIKLATFEREPYIGKYLPENGYVGELITTIFDRMGYKAEFTFYPHARANVMFENGLVDGMFPIYRHEKLTAPHWFSAPFPGDKIGMLIRKGEVYELPNDKNSTVKYSIGAIRGAELPEHLKVKFPPNKELVTTDRQNIHKLALRRIDVVLIDKYTAADLITREFPHLIGKLEFVDMGISRNSFHVGFRKSKKNSRQLITEFNQTLQEIIRDKTLIRILNKHGFFPDKHIGNGKVVLSIASVDNPDMKVMRDLSDEYERLHPEVKLDWKMFDEITLRKRLTSDLAIIDGQFDIITISAFEIPIWAGYGRLSPLPLPDDKYSYEDILPAVRKHLTQNKKLYALPFYAESSMTYYRQDLFEQKGLIMPLKPTYSDIEFLASKLHDPKNQIYGICLRGKPGWGANINFFTTMLNAFGGRWFDESWNATIDTPEWHQALTLYKKLVSEYGPPSTPGNNYSENLNLFAKGSCALWIDATVAASSLLNPEFSTVYNKTGFAAAPVQVTDNGAQWLYIWALAVPISSKNKEEAADFIRWSTSKEYIRLTAERKGWSFVPPGTRVSTYENKQYHSAAPFAEFVLEAMVRADKLENTLLASPYKSISFVELPSFPAMGDGVGRLLTQVLTDEITVDNALKRAQYLVTKIQKLQ